MTFEVGLPLPAVSANYRGSWHARHRARSMQRDEARKAAKAAMPNRWEPLGSFSVHYAFRFATKRRRDLDNLVFAMKATLDGVQDAGLVADDAGCVALSVRRERVAEGESPGVRVEVRQECATA